MPLTYIRNLGSGGFGTVDLVVDEFGRHFARKTFSVNQPMPLELIENVKKRFVREAQLQSGITHRNIVSILHVELSVDPPFYLMPVAESSLDKDLEVDRRLGGRYSLALSDIISGLEEMHSMQMYHRDLKPQNVLRFRDVAGEVYYAISDFGLISLQESRLSQLTSTGMRKSADYYTAPEIARDLRRASPQSDIYSLACILHDMVGVEDRVPCNEIREDGEFGPLLLSCTRSDPTRRFQSVRGLRDAIVSVSAGYVPVSNPAADSVVHALDGVMPLTPVQVQSLVDYLEDNWNTADGTIILMKLSAEQLQHFCETNAIAARRLAILIANWVSGSTFGFEFCDALAQRLNVLIVNLPYDAKADCILALLELGTSHNRWYVERVFVSLCGPDMEEGLAKRLAVEFRADSSGTCRRIAHLEQSITVSRSILHPILTATLAEICQ